MYRSVGRQHWYHQQDQRFPAKGTSACFISSEINGGTSAEKPYLSQSENSLLGSNDTSSKHDKVILNLSVMRETSHWCDGLVGDVIISGSVVLDYLAILGVDT